MSLNLEERLKKRSYKMSAKTESDVSSPVSVITLGASAAIVGCVVASGVPLPPALLVRKLGGVIGLIDIVRIGAIDDGLMRDGRGGVATVGGQ